MPEAAQILTEALGRPIAFAQTPIEQVRRNSEHTALMLQWFERVGYSADIAGLEGEFGRALTKLPDWARRATKWALKGETHGRSHSAVFHLGRRQAIAQAAQFHGREAVCFLVMLRQET